MGPVGDFLDPSKGILLERQLSTAIHGTDLNLSAPQVVVLFEVLLCRSDRHTKNVGETKQRTPPRNMGLIRPY